MSRSAIALILALGIVCTAAACTDETLQTGAGTPAGTPATGAAAPDPSTAPGSTEAGHPSGTEQAASGTLRTVADVEADLDQLVGPEVALRWVDQVAPPCITSLMATEAPAGSAVLFGRADDVTLTEAALEAWLTRLDGVAQVVPSVDSHYIVVGDSWELLIGIWTDRADTGQSSDDVAIDVDATAVVAPEPLPDGMGYLEEACSTTTSRFTATGTALGE